MKRMPVYWKLCLLGLSVFIAVFLYYPVLFIIKKAFFPLRGFSMEFFRILVGSSVMTQTIFNSFLIGIIVTLAIPGYNATKVRIIEGEVYMLFSKIRNAEELYYAEYGAYLAPVSSSVSESAWREYLGVENPNTNDEFRFIYEIKEDGPVYYIRATAKPWALYGFSVHQLDYYSKSGSITRTLE